MHGPRPFTATGLGDRIHQCTVAWCFAPAVLHLNADHLRGGQFNNKPESWFEIVGLFPPGAVRLELHTRSFTSERAWMNEAGAAVWRYGDYPSPSDPPEAVDVEPALRSIPRLRAEAQDVELPDRFFTVQWDANGSRRTVPPEMRRALEARHPGLEPVVIGGEAQEPLRWSLKHIAYALSRAEFHLGADSAFMHLALLYLPPERLRVYTRELTHHTRRARANGAEVTLC